MQLEAKTTALVLIDLQKGVLAMPVQPHPAAVVYERSMRLAQRSRAAGVPVIRVRVGFAADFADAPKALVDQPMNLGGLPPGWDEFPEALHPADLAITKHHWGAFHGTELDLQLRRRGVSRIILGGIATSIGVESTARSAYEHGYELVIAEDLCSCVNADTHASSIKYILPRLARITNSESIAFA